MLDVFQSKLLTEKKKSKGIIFYINIYFKNIHTYAFSLKTVSRNTKNIFYIFTILRK